MTNDIKHLVGKNELSEHFKSVRKYSLSLISALSAEDCQLQAMAEREAQVNGILRIPVGFLKHFYSAFIAVITKYLTLSLKYYLILTTTELVSNLSGATEAAYRGRVLMT